jgi:hypothetical protein
MQSSSSTAAGDRFRVSRRWLLSSGASAAAGIPLAAHGQTAPVGQCGACTVHVGGRRFLSCLTLAVSVRQPVTAIDGLAAGHNGLHPMQQAFIDQDAFQCGYCTPGQIMSAGTCIKEGLGRSAGAAPRRCTRHRWRRRRRG